MMLSPEKRLAAAFSNSLIDEIGFGNILNVVSMNATIAYRGACASHDFCDANVIMAKSFRHVFGREPNPNSAKDAGMWSRAWDIAKEFRFDAARIRESE